MISRTQAMKHFLQESDRDGRQFLNLVGPASLTHCAPDRVQPSPDVRGTVDPPSVQMNSPLRNCVNIGLPTDVSTHCDLPVLTLGSKYANR